MADRSTTPAHLRALATVLLALFAAVGPVKADVPLEQAMAAVFTVHTADDEDRFLGSAFLWGADLPAPVGKVAVTNAHVVGNATEVRLTDAQGRQQIATVIGCDPSRDVAVISVQSGQVGLIPSTSPPRLGAEVWALGAPLGLAFTVTEGRISALARQVEAAVPVRMIQHDAALNPGSSGGPLLDDRGALLGMNAQIADGSRMFVGIAYAIPARDLSRIVQGLMAGTLRPLPKLGLSARAVDRQLATALGIPASGLLVDRVAEGGLAQRAGILPGDVILALNAAILAHPGDLAFAIEAAQTQPALDFTVLRAGRVVVLIADSAAADATGLRLRALPEVPVRPSSYGLDALGIGLGNGGVISTLAAASPALVAGLEQGDRILMLNGQVMTDSDLGAARFSRPVLLLLLGTNGATRHVVIDPWATGKAIHPTGGANMLDPNVVLF